MLEIWSRPGRTEPRYRHRARIILMAAEGKSTDEIASHLHARRSRVAKWRVRFGQAGLAGLHDAVRPGRVAKLCYPASTTKRVLEQLNQRPPSGYSCWNGRLVAQALGDVTKGKVWKVLREQKLCLERRQSWCVSTDPEFAQKAADIVGLYLNPPENAVVLSVDEKPGIQALERAQGWIRLPNGKALSGFAHEYKRHGTTTLFAALEVATGQVQAGHYRRRRRREFLAFMNEVVAEYPGKKIHVILDNLTTHKPKQDRWLKDHQEVHFHYTPTHGSWLNQVECWFSILSRQALRGASFTSPQQVREAIDRFIAAYNQRAHPFEWRKSEVRQQNLKEKVPS